MNETYEIRMKNEFKLLQKLQNYGGVNNDTVKIIIQYKEGEEYKSILESPLSRFWPTDFRVAYKMPMFVGPGQLKKDWNATFLFSVPESVLMNPSSSVNVKIEGGKFPEGSIPYHNHVSRAGTWFCTGGAWNSAQQGNGIWYFIVAMGSILNMNRGFVVEDEQEAKYHLNYEAFLFWKNQRNKQPVTKINWPFNLPTIPSFADSKNAKFSFGKPEKKEKTKPSFSFGQKK